jgi:hypothetical protein
LRDGVRDYAIGPGSADPDTDALVQGVSGLSEASATLVTKAQRSLPPLLSALIFVTAVLLQAVGGMADVKIARPPLLPMWALLVTIAIWVIPAPGSIGINLSPLEQVAEAILQ